ncbi:MAG TPA: DNA-protecting protein DprA [Acidobacterium sp.]|nr:DNA-protecting protein DprA [Acidobacterium sp.]
MGPRRILQAVEAAGSAQALLDLPLTQLESLRLPAEAAQFLHDGRALRAAQQEAERVAAAGAQIVTCIDEAYPERLREIYDAPPILWVRGDASLLKRPSIAVVGTRHPTPYGAGMAEMLSRDLAANGLLILSGMARGIDTAAHKGALAAKKPTLAIWGTGVDVIYPKENKALAEQIVATGGAIVSELPLGTFPAPQNFPKRNRILSGISFGVLVVEGGEFSGTRVTARCALEQSREVFAVPGNVTNKQAWGPNTLIKQGAKLTATWEDVWEDLPTDVRVAVTADAVVASPEPVTASLFDDNTAAPVEAALLRILRHDEALQMEEILQKLEGELSSSEIFTALFELELAGRIRQLPGKNYVKSFPAARTE